MKTRSLLLLAWLAMLPATLLAVPTAEVRCTDGSQFKGTLLEIGPDRAKFEADFLAQPVPLRLDKILEIGLPPHRGDFTGDHIASATLSNGDMLRGELTGVTATEISLRTWYGGEMKLRRSMVDTLDIQNRPELIYAGPTGLDGWTQSKDDSWTYEDGVLRPRQQAMISRDLELPAKTHFAFDVAWRSVPRFRFIFCSDDILSNEPENCYFLMTNGHYMELRKRTPRNNSMSIGGSIQIPEFRSREKVRLELLVDRKSGLIRLLVNGRIAADWNDPEPQVGAMGGGIQFEANDTSLRLSRIEITSWDGTVEGKAEEMEDGFLDEVDEDATEPAEPEPDPTRIRLRNNDHVEGEMLGIEGGKVKLKTKFGDMDLPVSRLRSFPLRGKKEREDYTLGLYEKPKRYNGDVRAWFADGTRVTFRLESASDGRLKGYAQAFGQVDFDGKAFSRLEFNLYDPELDELRSADARW
jgi:hypothetical protein